MLILKADNIKKYYGDRLIIDIESLEVYSKDKLGIVGANGAGKTTLLNILSGTIPADKGTVKLYGSYSYITQLSDIEDGSVSAKAAREFNVYMKKAETLSGGEKTRLKIAKSLSLSSSIIFADEPTCNLDMKGIELLEEKLSSYKGALIIVSHDRELLDRLCSCIVEIKNGRIKIYKGNYSSYKAQKLAEEERQQFEYEQYTGKMKALKKAVEDKKQKVLSMNKTPKRMGNSEARLHKADNQKAKSKLNRSIKALQTRMQKLEYKKKPEKIRKTIFDLQYNPDIHGRLVISGEGICKSFGQRILFDDASFEIKNSSKTALIGDNGTGKTTLIQMIMEGAKGIRIWGNTRIGYFRQDLSILDENKTVIENVMENSSFSESNVRTILSRLLFKADDIFKNAKVLSGGERVKASIAKLLLSDNNMLILDEPSNYLDIYSTEALEHALREYSGTLLIVSHDRRFIENIADRILIIDNKKIKTFEGSLNEYIKRKDMPNMDNSNMKKMVLENRLAQILGKLSVSTKDDEKKLLDKEYNIILKELKKISKQS
jgi:macrolide transport system ATP-binding/permease protein